MKLIGLAQLKTASLLALLGVIGNLSFSPAYLRAAEKAKETPVTIRLDFIVGGNHAPWFVAWEKGFYAKRGLNVTIQPGTGSADTIRTIAAGGADVGFANVSTAIVGRSRGAPIVSVAQLGYIAVTVLWREETAIKSLKDLEKIMGHQPRTGAMVSAAGACQNQQLGLQVHQDRGDRAASSAGGFAGQEGRLHHDVPCLER